MDRKETVDELRDLMGTGPGRRPSEPKSRFVYGVEDIKVELIPGSFPRNPYRAMYAMATTCWGTRGADGHYQVDKWERTRPEHRFLVVLAVLRGEALPLALEAPSFTFTVSGPSRAAFDQIARARVGVVFSARGMRDNSWEDAQFRIPNIMKKNPEALDQLQAKFIEAVKLYKWMLEKGQGTWQAARSILPMNVVYAWSMAINYASMVNLLSKRLMFCEQEDTVAVAWLLKKKMSEQFPLLASYLRPTCDKAKKCVYHKNYTLSEAFGCLFSGCGRWPESDTYQEFNESSSDPKTISEQLGIDVVSLTEPIAQWDQLSVSDKELFCE